MRAFLTKTEPMTETAAAENEVRSGTANLESRTLQNIPAERPPDDDLEIPTANSLALFTFERDEFCTACVVVLADQNLIESIADIGSRITLQRAQEIGAANDISPLRMRAGIAVFIAHTAQIRSRRHSPEVLDG